MPHNVNIVELGNLRLTASDERAVVAYLKTLTDENAAPVLCLADFDRNGFVIGGDFELFTEKFKAWC